MCDWSKHVTWPNIPQLKWGISKNIWEYSPIFKTACIAKKIWRIINTIASRLGQRYARIWDKQIMSTDKYASIFPHQMNAIVYISNARSQNICKIAMVFWYLLHYISKHLNWFVDVLHNKTWSPTHCPGESCMTQCVHILRSFLIIKSACQLLDKLHVPYQTL